MKKMTKLSLDKLAKEMPVISELAQKAYIGGGDGSAGNPFTESEMDSMVASGTWSGGNVVGMGYVGTGGTASGTIGGPGATTETWDDLISQASAQTNYNYYEGAAITLASFTNPPGYMTYIFTALNLSNGAADLTNDFQNVANIVGSGNQCRCLLKVEQPPMMDGGVIIRRYFDDITGEMIYESFTGF